jgi:histidyl-tRNA synthetase
MMQRAIERVRGFNDLDAEAYARTEAAVDSLKRSFRLSGYSLIDVPMLENLELYMRKNGADILSKLYGLTDQGRRELAMRPEFTASVIRALAPSVDRAAGPVRVAYAGPVFRYEKPQRATTRQFTQAGVELLGEPSPTADADVVALACEAALSTGIARVHVVLGHLGPLRALLSHLTVDGYAEGYLLEHLEYFNRGPAQQKLVRQQLGLDEAGDESSDDADLGELARALGDLTPEAARDVVSGLLQQMGVDLAGNSRTPDEIIARVLEKAQRHAAARSGARRENLERALQFCSALGNLRGEPEIVLREAGKLLSVYDVPVSALDELRVVVELFRDHQLANVRLTLAPGMARGIAYYSGLIFEMYASPSGTTSPEEDEIQICGGGRYDGLPLAITGSRSFPALGFAFGVERILHCIPEAATRAGRQKTIAIVLQSQAQRREGLRIAEALKRNGYAAVVTMASTANGKLAERLRRAGHSAAISLHNPDIDRIQRQPDIVLFEPQEAGVDAEQLRMLSKEVLRASGETKECASVTGAGGPT